MARQTAARLVIHSIGSLVTPCSEDAPLRGSSLSQLEVIEHAAIAIGVNGTIMAAGREVDVRAAVATDEETRFLDAGGLLALPGFVDCHTHPVFAGDRAEEFELRNTGASYEQLHEQGGGIRRTVRLTREASTDQLEEQLARHCEWMLASGTTTAEAKSGYGLTIEDELRLLRCIAAVDARQPLHLVPTALAAHTVPAEFDGDPDSYLDEVAIPTLDRAAREELAGAADVFLERGSFSADQAQRYLNHAAKVGMQMRLHTNQFSDQGGVRMAVDLGARSVDHLEVLDPEDVARLGQSSTAAVLLPLSALMLNRPQAPGRALVDAGAIVAAATDFNPGSSYSESVPLAMSMACIGCGLTSAEALSAVTVNAAWVLGLHETVGRLAPGYRGNVVLVDQPDVRHLCYHVGAPAVRYVVAAGEVVVEQGRAVLPDNRAIGLDDAST